MGERHEENKAKLKQHQSNKKPELTEEERSPKKQHNLEKQSREESIRDEKIG